MTTCGTTPPPPRASPSNAPRRAPASSTSPQRPSTANLNASPSTRATPRDPSRPTASRSWRGEQAAQMLAPGAAVLRLFNAYGPGQTGTYAGVVSKFIERAKRGLLPVIYGDGTQIRDFIHVADVARFVEVVLDRGAAGVYNVGTGRAVSIRELAAVVMRLAGLGGEPLYGPPRPGDIKHSAAAVSKARALGWQPQMPLEEGLRRLWTLTSSLR